MNEQERKATDYLTETLQTELQARMDIFQQMLYMLELQGNCRTVYHRLARVLFSDAWPDNDEG